MAQRDPEVLDRDKLIDQLRSLGIVPGDIVMVHASLRALGPVVGGAETVAWALLDAVAPGGTIMAYVSWEHSPYDATLNGKGLDRAVKDQWPVFRADSAPYPGFGILNSCLVRLPGARRSSHPDASMVAVGPHAEDLVSPHLLGTGAGPGSPLDRFVACRGKVLMLGAPLDAVTVLHYAEAVAKVPGKRWVEYEMPVTNEGVTTWCRVRELDTNGILDVFAGDAEMDAVETIARSYVKLGRHREGRVGQALCRVFDAEDIVRYGVEYLESRFGGSHSPS